MNILFVENHAVFAKTVTKQFMSQHNVTIVPTTVEAWEQLMSHSFDVALIDYDLDNGKGDELIHRIRTEASPIYIISVSAHQNGNKANIQAGANACCPKHTFDKIEDMLRAR